MDIGFIWDEFKYEQVKKEHHVYFYEVVSAFDDACGYEIPDPGGFEDRWLWVGQTALDRILAIVYSEVDLPLYRVITAFDAQGMLFDEYTKRKKR